VIARERIILEADSSPRIGLESLVGKHSISGFRAKVYERLGVLAQIGSPLFVLIDDIAGSSLISSGAWTDGRASTSCGRRKILGGV
jgi:hypothetical protein